MECPELHINLPANKPSTPHRGGIGVSLLKHIMNYIRCKAMNRKPMFGDLNYTWGRVDESQFTKNVLVRNCTKCLEL